VHRYFEGTYTWLKMAIEHQGFDGLRDELNETCFHHMITLEPLEPDDEDKTFTKTGAGGCRVGKGFLFYSRRRCSGNLLILQLDWWRL
jgi:hypothetical protein